MIKNEVYAEHKNSLTIILHGNSHYTETQFYIVMLYSCHLIVPMWMVLVLFARELNYELIPSTHNIR